MSLDWSSILKRVANMGREADRGRQEKERDEGGRDSSWYSLHPASSPKMSQDSSLIKTLVWDNTSKYKAWKVDKTSGDLREENVNYNQLSQNLIELRHHDVVKKFIKTTMLVGKFDINSSHESFLLQATSHFIHKALREVKRVVWDYLQPSALGVFCYAKLQEANLQRRVSLVTRDENLWNEFKHEYEEYMDTWKSIGDMSTIRKHGGVAFTTLSVAASLGAPAILSVPVFGVAGLASVFYRDEPRTCLLNENTKGHFEENIVNEFSGEDALSIITNSEKLTIKTYVNPNKEKFICLQNGDVSKKYVLTKIEFKFVAGVVSGGTHQTTYRLFYFLSLFFDAAGSDFKRICERELQNALKSYR